MLLGDELQLFCSIGVYTFSQAFVPNGIRRTDVPPYISDGCRFLPRRHRESVSWQYNIYVLEPQKNRHKDILSERLLPLIHIVQCAFASRYVGRCQ